MTDKTMKRFATNTLTILVFLVGSSLTTFAQVKKIHMEIDGYLCGY